jgi:hypothetical protein
MQRSILVCVKWHGNKGTHTPPGLNPILVSSNLGHQSTEQPPLAQMSELDRFGLAGLLRMIHSESPDVASTLMTRMVKQTMCAKAYAEKHISMCQMAWEQRNSYSNVANIQPLQSRIPGFSDETLFFIFYSMPRDIMQELVAEELMGDESYLLGPSSRQMNPTEDKHHVRSHHAPHQRVQEP